MPRTLHKLEASSHKEVHFTSTTENKPSAGVPKRKWGGFRARPPATAPRTRSQTKICGGEGMVEVEQRDGAVMALNGDGRGAGEEKKKRKKKNKRETRRIGNRKKGKRGEIERGA
ncbi:hypothetical protein FH972_000477 [Carpinus fangiana]|uniref:Uncharacterized protein n=1 Tax=Carpinus fangiana TaxID=176857 RepID=A0A5N6Q972_9ROSI|nr:hypothetical protein FH972_000477 [Carpinus fangiana]